MVMMHEKGCGYRSSRHICGDGDDNVDDYHKDDVYYDGLNSGVLISVVNAFACFRAFKP